MEVQLNMMLLPSITCISYAAVREKYAARALWHHKGNGKYWGWLMLETMHAQCCSFIFKADCMTWHKGMVRCCLTTEIGGTAVECSSCMKELHEDGWKMLTVKIVLLGPCHLAVKEGTAFSLKKTISTGM